uniref:beta-defensin 126 n=1 Tax=Arvicanthis niloticus TaxID=61156 RepID=UPI0014866DE7|nr:beta-defensin 126 [Arvicanthis niloticus]
MKSLLSALVVIMFLAHLVTGNWYVKKCANTLGNCRKTCREGEQHTEPATSKCPIGKLCCVLDFKITGHCGGSSQSSEGNQDSAAAGGQHGGGGDQAAGATQGTGATQASESIAASTAAA